MLLGNLVRLWVFALIAVVSADGPAFAAGDASPWDTQDFGRARLVAAETSINDGQVLVGHLVHIHTCYHSVVKFLSQGEAVQLTPARQQPMNGCQL